MEYRPGSTGKSIARGEACGQVAGPGLSYSAYFTASVKPGDNEEGKEQNWWRGEYGLHGFELVAYQGGALVELRRQTRAGLPVRAGGGRRGVITKFSAASRRRLMREFNKLDEAHLVAGYFATLTYPAEYPCVAETKRHLDSMCKRIMRRFPSCGLIWRVEPQKRGAPHYHLFLLGLRPEGDVHEWRRGLRRWLAAAWYDVVGSGDPRHLVAGTQFDPVKNIARAKAYAAKNYFAKDKHQFSDPFPGRHWGVVGNVAQYEACQVRIPLTWREACDVFRVMDNARLSVARRYKSAEGRRRGVRAARRRRWDKFNRWYVAPARELVRYFLAVVPDDREVAVIGGELAAAAPVLPGGDPSGGFPDGPAAPAGL